MRSSRSRSHAAPRPRARPQAWLRAPASALALALILAGCAKDEGPVTASAIEPGFLTGTVTDAAMIPLAGVNVTVDGANASTLTDEAGAFAFTILPGEYVVLASHPDHRAAALRASVLSAQAATLAFQLGAIPRIVPRVELAEAKGYLGCALLVTRGSERTSVPCGQEDPNERPTVAFGVASHEGLETVVLELAWDASSEGARSLRVDAAARAGADTVALGSAEGGSPLSLVLPGRLVQGDTLTLTASAAGGFLDEEAGSDAGLVLQQEFTAYASFFYHEPARGGYSAIAAG